MPASACVSTSSVKKTFVTPSSLISTSDDVRLMESLLSLRMRYCSRMRSTVPRRHVRQNHLVADVQPGDDFDGVDRAAPELHLRRARRRQPSAGSDSLNRPTVLCSWPNAGRPT